MTHASSPLRRVSRRLGVPVIGALSASALCLSAFAVAPPASASASAEATASPVVSPAADAPLRDPAWPIDTRGDGCSTPLWPKAGKGNRYRRLLVIGDSLIRNSRTTLEKRATRKGWLPTTRCWGAKGTDWGLQQVLRAKQLKQLPDTVVVSLGTNDIWWLGLDLGRGVDAMMQAIGPDREVYWVNLWFGPHSYDRLPTPYAANRLLRAKAKQYPNLTIVNFAKAFRDAEKRGVPVGWEDGVHLNAKGNSIRVTAILKAIGKPVAPEPDPPTEPPPPPDTDEDATGDNPRSA